MELMQANRQWSSRPDDERFLSLTSLNDFVQSQRRLSAGKIVSSRALTVSPAKLLGSTADSIAQFDNQALTLQGPSGQEVSLTNWSFGQLAARAGAPAGYLRTLPSPLTADLLNYGLKHVRDVEDTGILLTRDESNNALITARAVTGPNYGRIWNSTITQSLVNTFGDGVTGTFRVPGEFGPNNKPITKESTTLYASDRDMWVFLADEQNRIELPNRRNGRTGSLARGFFVWNSEVGAATFGIGTFLFDYMCGNHIIWGAEEYKEIRIRHTASAPDKFIEQAAPTLLAMSKSSAVGITEGLKAAQQKKIENVDEFLASRFSKSQVTAIKQAHIDDEDRPIETIWDAATGITAYARDVKFTDDRVKLEREAGKVLKLAA